MKKLVATACLLACAVLSVTPSFADLYSGPFSLWITDPNEADVSPNGRDIAGVGLASDSTSYYFRMELVAAPAANSVGTIYGIYIGLPGDSGLTVENADMSLEASLRKRSNIYFNYTLTDWTSGEPVQSTPEFSARGTILEWKVDKDLLGSYFSFMGATSSSTKIIDTTSVAATPIPGAVWLLGSGLVGLIALRRRTTM